MGRTRRLFSNTLTQNTNTHSTLLLYGLSSQFKKTDLNIYTNHKECEEGASYNELEECSACHIYNVVIHSARMHCRTVIPEQSKAKNTPVEIILFQVNKGSLEH